MNYQYPTILRSVRVFLSFLIIKMVKVYLLAVRSMTDIPHISEFSRSKSALVINLIIGYC